MLMSSNHCFQVWPGSGRGRVRSLPSSSTTPEIAVQTSVAPPRSPEAEPRALTGKGAARKGWEGPASTADPVFKMRFWILRGGLFTKTSPALRVTRSRPCRLVSSCLKTYPSGLSSAERKSSFHLFAVCVGGRHCTLSPNRVWHTTGILLSARHASGTTGM